MSEYSLSAPETSEIWKQTCVELQQELSPAVFNTWVVNNPVTQIELSGDDAAICTITSPTAFHSTNLKKNLGDKLIAVLTKLLGRSVTLAFKIGTPIASNEEILNHKVNTVSPIGGILGNQGNQQKAPENQPTVQQNQQQSQSSHQFSPEFTKTFTASTEIDQSNQTNQPQQLQQNHQIIQPSRPQSFGSPRVEDLFSQTSLQNATVDRAKVAAANAGLRPDYIFETFAVSSTNEMAHAAATAVSQRPGTAYNPLFLYGGVGVGKTHLMHALAHNILQQDPTVKVIYCSGEEFTNEIVSAIQNKKALRFKDKYRTAQVLLIDDIQFIAGKNTVQEEFFHTFNALTQQARQIVLTSDRPPHEINLLEDRLKSRFEAGLMVDIQQPSFELRTAILLIKSKASQVNFTMEIAQLIASKVDSARKIEGFIKRIKSEVELNHKEITMELVEEILGTEGDAPKYRLKVTPNDVIRAVANHFHVKQTAVRGKNRVATLVHARHVAMYLLKAELHMPLTEIGRWFSNRDHTSALHATRKIEKEMRIDSLLQRDISALRMSLSAISK